VIRIGYGVGGAQGIVGEEIATGHSFEGVEAQAEVMAERAEGRVTAIGLVGAVRSVAPDPADALDDAVIADAAVLYLEGYLWDPEEPRRAMRRAIAAARAAGRKVAFTLSDSFVISRHGDDFRALIADGQIDILFANEHELAALTGHDDFHAGIAALAPQVDTLVVTRSEQGAHAVSGGEHAHVPAVPVAHVVDTTGAGDLFAAGFLFGHVRGAPLATCLSLGAVCAAEVIAHYGARPEADLRALVAPLL
jgi:sugar/nucleoside kinase (ribokinase family)